MTTPRAESGSFTPSIGFTAAPHKGDPTGGVTSAWKVAIDTSCAATFIVADKTSKQTKNTRMVDPLTGLIAPACCIPSRQGTVQADATSLGCMGMNSIETGVILNVLVHGGMPLPRSTRAVLKG
jgi:hypothetical protein